MKAVYSILLWAALTGATTGLFWRKTVFIPQELNWTDAQAYCRKNYFDLLTLETDEEALRFRKNFLNREYDWCWLGLSKTPDTTVYTQWSDGTALVHTNWHEKQPNQRKYEHCVSVFVFEWYDQFCYKGMSFFCYTWEPQLVLVQEMKTWHEALEHCRTFYTDLIILTTEKDMFVINKKLTDVQTPSVWTGLRFLDGSWFWVNGKPLDDGVSLLLCPAPVFRCGAKMGVGPLENRDCEEKMNFVCYY